MFSINMDKKKKKYITIISGTKKQKRTFLCLGVVFLTISSIAVYADIYATTVKTFGDRYGKEGALLSTTLMHSASAGLNTLSKPSAHKAPFEMPIKGDKFDIFQPLYDMDDLKKNPQLLASPKEFVSTFEERIEWVNTMITLRETVTPMAAKDHAVKMYLEMIKSLVSATAFNQAELSVQPSLGNSTKNIANPFNLSHRENGTDWTYAGDTMTGWRRLDNVRDLLQDAINEDIKGDYIETGVWRGGSSVFARAVMNVLENDSTRVSYVCDSFSGLPPGKKELDVRDIGWDNTPYLAAPTEVVANNFIKYGLLDANVVFAKGFFNETMPHLRKKIDSIAVMRLDGDMYESTVDVLYNLYDKLSIGGYLIMDDWFGFPSRTACEDFWAVHEINPNVIAIDNLAAYWQKEDHIDIQYWRYEQSKFKADPPTGESK